MPFDGTSFQQQPDVLPPRVYRSDPVLGVLLRARHLVATNWTRGITSPGYCVLKAITAAAGIERRKGDRIYYGRATFVETDRIYRWNDSRLSNRPVVAALDRAILAHRARFWRYRFAAPETLADQCHRELLIAIGGEE